MVLKGEEVEAAGRVGGGRGGWHAKRAVVSHSITIFLCVVKLNEQKWSYKRRIEVCIMNIL